MSDSPVIWPPSGQVFLAVGATDMRKSINGLSILNQRLIQAKTQERYQSEIEYLQEQIRLLRNEVFGRSSKKSIVEHPDQILLFEICLQRL